jgi:two-component system, NtrC family, nitrogen regulation response regulator NtrX
VPPLNDRREDIPILVEFFNEKITEEQGGTKKEFTPEAIELLKEYNWTGNIRELRNVVERLIILGGSQVTEEDVRLFASKN